MINIIVAAVSAHFHATRTPRMQIRAAEFGGYDVGDTGQVRFAP
jgi:hypothetical protein